MTLLTPALEKKIETLFNKAVENDENLTDSGTMNWDWVFADVWIDLSLVGATFQPELENFNFSATHAGPFQIDLNNLLERMADAWEEDQFDHVEMMESFPW